MRFGSDLRGGGGGDLRRGVGFVSLGLAATGAGDSASWGWLGLGHEMLMHSTYPRIRSLLATLVTLVRRSFFCPGLRSCVALSEQKLSLRGAGTLSETTKATNKSSGGGCGLWRRREPRPQRT